MRVLIASSSYLSEIDAVPSRITNMAEGLPGLGIKADVLTCSPNYPKERIFDGYRGTFSETEGVNGIAVFGHWTYASIPGRPLVRPASICSFVMTLWCSASKREHIKSYDKVIVQPPPVLVAASAMLLFRYCHRKKVILNVSDPRPLPAVELGTTKEDGAYYRVMGHIKRFLYHRATACQGQGKEIVNYIKRYKPGKASLSYRSSQHRFVLPNQPLSSWKLFRTVYAGSLDAAQNILELIKCVDFKRMGAELHLFGGGNQALEIKDCVGTHGRGILYHGSLPKERMREEFTRYHASIIPLTVRIRGAVPPKLFDLLPLGVPTLFCGGGEGEEIVRENQLGLISVPGDYERLSKDMQTMGHLPDEEYRQLEASCLRLSQTAFCFERQLEVYECFLSAF